LVLMRLRCTQPGCGADGSARIGKSRCASTAAPAASGLLFSSRRGGRSFAAWGDILKNIRSERFPERIESSRARLRNRKIANSTRQTILALLCASLAALVFQPRSASASQAPAFNLYFSGTENLVLDRLDLDPTTHRVADLSDAQCAVFDDALPAPGPALDALKARVAAGIGVVIITGPNTDPAALAALTGGAITQTGTVEVAAGAKHAQEIEKYAAIIEYVGPAANPLAANVSWKSAVRVHERSLLRVGRAATVLVATSGKDPVRAHTPVLVELKSGAGTIYVLNVWLRQGDQRARIASYRLLLGGIAGAQNYDFQRWAYFNWLLYDLSRAAAGVAAAPYGSWIGSPVPDSAQIIWLGAIFSAMFGGFVLCYIAVRRYSLRHPEQLEQFYLPRKPAAPRPASLGAAATRAVSAAEPAPSRGDPRWEKVGFHRPLSGFFYNYLLALMVMIPFNFIVTFYIERNFVNPFLEARGAWAAVTQFMLFFFTLLDLGTGQAMVKYFAEYRVKEPGRAITYAQFFIWFHALAGMFQITALGLVAAIWMPHTAMAFLTWFVILHTLIQFPGFIAIFSNLFRALQRFDYAQLLIVLTYVLNPFVQLSCGVYGRHWGLMHPVFGEGMGVIFGFAIGGVIANLMMGAFCAVFYDKMGFRLATIFLAHFDRDTVRKSFIYGIKLTGGQVLGATSWALVPVIMGILLPNFLELNEIWILTYSLTFAYLETGAYIFTTLMPSISESYSQSMMFLTRRYLDQGLRWGLIITSMLGGAFVAFSNIFVYGLLPPQFVRAAGVMMLMHVFRTFDFTTRMPDQVFQGVGRTGLFTLTSLVENGGRIILSWYLIKWYGFNGVFYAFIISSLLKSAVAWPMMGYLIAWPSISVWQTLINPIIAAFGNYYVLHEFALAVWRGPGHAGNAWIVVLLCLFGSLPVYMFISGLLGWDRAALREFRDAAELVPPPFGAIARMAHRMVEIGSMLSPLHNRFPGNMVEEASAQANALTAMKAEMH
jgi:O-antigen/teichoic acid export membrane protein